MTTRSTTGRGSAPAVDAAPRTFRADIQALRAIAIFTVLVYHLWPERLPGGFIGVDVFFVISGFLITQHLMQEVDRTGRVSLTRFWARRIRRLLPAAYLVLAASLILLALFMPPVTWQLNLETIRACAAYVINWFLGFQAVDYLAAANDPSMVLHYWSLAVEEQFYLVWPLLIVLALAVGRRSSAAGRRRWIIWVLVAVFVITLLASVVATPRSPALAFYATPLRAWEFAAGGILSLLPAATSGRIPSAARSALSWSGWLLIIAGSLLIHGADVQFPGWIALVPVLGAAACLLAGDPEGRLSPRPLLRNRIVQWIGDYSYSIYLWHWPLIIAAPWVIGGPLTWPHKLAIAGLTLVLAFAMKRTVEDPIRTSAWWRTNRRRAYVFAATGAVALVAITSLWLLRLDGVWEEKQVAAEQQLDADTSCFAAAAMSDDRCDGAHERPAPLDIAFAATDIDDALNHCQQPTQGTEAVLCTFGSDDPTLTVAVVGNSHALRLIPALERYGAERGWQIILAAKTNCLGPITSEIDPDLADCQTWSENVADAFAARGADVVVFGSHVGAGFYLTGQEVPDAEARLQAEDGIAATYQRYSDAGMGVVVVGDVPGTRPDDAPRCVAADADAADPCARQRADVDVSNLLVDVALEHPDVVSYFPMSDFLCDASTCHAVVGGVVAYSDSHHLTTTFSRSLAPFLGPVVEQSASVPG